MHSEAVLSHNDHLHHQNEGDSTDVFGFWMYILTDCLLFGCLFATYVVLINPSLHGPTLGNYLNLRDILIETFLLLISNLTFCLAILSLNRSQLFKVQFWLILTFLFGAGFVYMEITEFIHIAHAGFRWDTSAEASAFFTLVGTHGLHVSFGLLWIILMVIQLPILKINHITKRRMTYLGLFWNFLDIVWIFVFTVVYLMGAI
ncbi:cytochrome o ubiquinol oxidase subunit III [Gammaproteobacteria bacterium]|nr:cytochrome o ubiquinol oxidase subunit III [Gammaproteobacteria bacterium]